MNTARLGNDRDRSRTFRRSLRLRLRSRPENSPLGGQHRVMVHRQIQFDSFSAFVAASLHPFSRCTRTLGAKSNFRQFEKSRARACAHASVNVFSMQGEEREDEGGRRDRYLAARKSMPYTRGLQSFARVCASAALLTEKWKKVYSALY